MERAISFVEGDTLTRSHLEFIFSESHVEHADERTEWMLVTTDIPFKDAKTKIVEVFEKEYLAELLKRNDHNISKASREAKIDRKHLRNLLKKYGISSKE